MQKLTTVKESHASPDSLPGLYVHIPFCRGKCPYCDFYSLKMTQETADSYTNALIRTLSSYDEQYGTVYFGGGTPTLLGARRLAEILSHIDVVNGAEITVEGNPSDICENYSEREFALLKDAGVNRMSLGMQSAVENERKALGRRAGAAEVSRAVSLIRSGGIENFSLDLMLGIPYQTSETLRRSLDFCIGSGASHISAYILKIEDSTPFAAKKENLALPEEDKVCDLYLETCGFLEESGMKQYEISNFAYPGKESRHNLKYWNCGEYRGIGAAAHSFIGGKRFYYPRSIDGFIDGNPPTDDGEGGDFEEYAMLRLRLTEGLLRAECRKRYGHPLPENVVRNAQSLSCESGGKLFTQADSERIALSPAGFLISNTLIAEILYRG